MSAGGVHRLLYGRRAHHRRKRRGRAGLRVRLDAPAVLRTLHFWCPVACLACSCAWLQCLAHNPFSHCFSVCAHDACQIKGKKHFFPPVAFLPAVLCVSAGVPSAGRHRLTMQPILQACLSWMLTWPVHLCRVPCYGVPTAEHCDVSWCAWRVVMGRCGP